VQYGGKIFYDGNSDTLQIVTRENNADKLGIVIARVTGNVGIGTTEPRERLTVGTGFHFHDGGHKVIGFGGAISPRYVTTAGKPFELRWAPTDGLLQIAADNTARSVGDSWSPTNIVTIRSDGNVGIGTTAPYDKLHVYGGGLRISSGAFGANGFVFEQNATSGHLNIRYKNPTDIYAEIMTLGYNGNVGIGTTAPEEMLHIQKDGNVYLKIHATTGSEQIAGIKLQRGSWLSDIYTDWQIYDSAGNLYFDTLESNTQTTRVFFKFDGNVGIGTTAPAYKLDVEGYVQAYGYYTGEIIEDNIFPEDSNEEFEKGMLLSLSSSSSTFSKSSKPYDEKLIGVATFDAQGIAKPVILGKFEVLVSGVNGKIEIGDPITSSHIPGVAMKATNPGRIIGIALENYDGEGIGKIMAFINPQWSLGQISEEGLIYTQEEIYQKEIQPAEILDQFTLVIKKSLEKLGLILQNGIAKVEKLFAKEIEVEKITTDKLCSKNGKCVDVTDELIEKLINLQITTNNIQQTASNGATSNETANNEQLDSERLNNEQPNNEQSCTPNWQCKEWEPLPEEICEGETFIQNCVQWIDLNNCGITETPTTTQEATGTKDCSTQTPSDEIVQ